MLGFKLINVSKRAAYHLMTVLRYSTCHWDVFFLRCNYSFSKFYDAHERVIIGHTNIEQHRSVVFVNNYIDLLLLYSVLILVNKVYQNSL